MKSDFLYDLIIIGGGISGSVLASKFLQNNPRKKVALVESGRRLGGRASTRISRSFKGWELNHGAPNLNICNPKKNPLLQNYIDELLEYKFIKIDDSDLILLDDDSNYEEIKNLEFSFGNNYLSNFSMSQLCKNIIEVNNIKAKVDFYFETLIYDLKFKDDEWTLISKNGGEFKSKYLICSTNLLSHKRSLEILNINQIPFRKAIPENKDKKIDLLLNFLDKQSFIPRLTFLIYTRENYSYKDSYYKKNRYFYLKKNLENKYKFERIIFQKQDKNKLGIVVHSKNIDFIDSNLKEKDEDILKQIIFTNFNELFKGNSSINQLNYSEKISVMKWRASQPLGHAVPLSLQFCKKSRVGFCGDWFSGDGFGRIEGSILSALLLANKFKNLY